MTARAGRSIPRPSRKMPAGPVAPGPVLVLHRFDVVATTPKGPAVDTWVIVPVDPRRYPDRTRPAVAA